MRALWEMCLCMYASDHVCMCMYVCRLGVCVCDAHRAQMHNILVMCVCLHALSVLLCVRVYVPMGPRDG